MTADAINQGEWHTIQCGAYQYTLPRRYQDPAPLGQGTFGAVIRATDIETGNLVAIKKILRPFETAKHAQRTYRELKLLMYLNHPDAQVVQLYNVFTPEKNLNEFQTLYFVLSFSDFDLNKVIRHYKPFAEKLIKLIIYSILRGLKFMHSAGVMHRDLKPHNIGIDKNSNVQIFDFGLARVSSNGDYTTYVATRCWRAPEVYTNKKQYTDKLDMWSVGCIMAELILLRTIFNGSDTINQLNRIFDILGTPDLATLPEICPPEFFNYISGLPPTSKQDFNELFGYKYGADPEIPISGVSPQGVDLLDRMLSFDYRARPSADEALAHPFFANLHDPMDEPTIERMIDEHEGQVYSVAMWKSIIWQMVEEFIPPSWVTEDLPEDA